MGRRSLERVAILPDRCRRILRSFPASRLGGKTRADARAAGTTPAPRARAIAASQSATVWSVYVPNGRTPAAHTTRTSWEFLAALRDAVADQLAGGQLVVAGDFNGPHRCRCVGPRGVHQVPPVTAAERRALAAGGARAGGHPARLKYGTPFTTGTTGRGVSTRTRGCASTWCTPTGPRRARQDAYVGRRRARAGPVRPRPGRGRPHAIGLPARLYARWGCRSGRPVHAARAVRGCRTPGAGVSRSWTRYCRAEWPTAATQVRPITAYTV